MNKEQIKQQIEETKKQLDMLESMLEGKKGFKKGDDFYGLSATGEVEEFTWEGLEVDYDFIKFGNAFHTRVEAEKERDKRFALAEIKNYIKENFGEWELDWSDPIKEKWYLFYNYNEKKWGYNYRLYHKHLIFLPYLETKEQCKQLITDCEEQFNILFR